MFYVKIFTSDVHSGVGNTTKAERSCPRSSSGRAKATALKDVCTFSINSISSSAGPGST